MPDSDHNDYQQSFASVGVFLEPNGSQLIGPCPLCNDHGEHLYANPKTGLWDCKSCEEKGNFYDLLRYLHEASLISTTTKDYLDLSKDRGIPVQYLRMFGLVKLTTTGNWAAPAYNTKGKLANLYNYAKLKGSDKPRFISAKGCKLHPFGTKLFPVSANKNTKSHTVWVCEGIWDAAALLSIFGSLRQQRKGPLAIDGLIRTKGCRDCRFKSPEKCALCMEGSHTLLSTNSVLALPGANTFNEEWAGYLKGCDVRICFDNDHPKKNKRGKITMAGWDGSKRVVGILEDAGFQGEVSVLPWGPDGYDPNLKSGYDLRDAVNDHKDKPRSALRFIVERLQKVERSPQLSNCRTVEPSRVSKEVSPFPVEVFPDALGSLIKAGSKSIPCPPDFLGVPMLAVLGTAIGRSHRIAIKPGWQESACVYTAIVARTGDGKSPALDLVAEPIHSFQKTLLADWQKTVRERSEKDSPGEEDKAVLRQILTTDATTESLAEVLQHNPRGILFLQDELAGWTRALGQYKQGRGNDRQVWLSSWSGAQTIVNRKGKSPIILDDPFVCVAGGIQPDMLGELSDSRGREDGFLQRILFCFANPVQQTWSETGVSEAVRGRYCSFVSNLLGISQQSLLRFSPGGRKAWESWIQSHLAELDTVGEQLRGAWAKMNGYCARLALIIHVCRHTARETKSLDVDGESMERATKLIGYFKSHARRVYQTMKRDSDTSRIGVALRWIKTQGGKVLLRDVCRYKVAGVKNTEEARGLLDDLVGLKHGTMTEGHRKDSFFFSLSDA